MKTKDYIPSNQYILQDVSVSAKTARFYAAGSEKGGECQVPEMPRVGTLDLRMQRYEQSTLGGKYVNWRSFAPPRSFVRLLVSLARDP